MSQYGKAGFQDMPKVVHLAASRKGGRVKTRKGFAAMSPERRKEIQSMGGLAKHANKHRETTEQTQEDNGGYIPLLADVLGDINEEV